MGASFTLSWDGEHGAWGRFMTCGAAHDVQCSGIVDWSSALGACVFEICRMASEGLAYLGVLALLAASGQAECVCRFRAQACKACILNLSNGLRRIDFGMVFSHCWRADGQAECVVDF